MISKISLVTNGQNFGHFARNSRKNIEKAIKEFYKSELGMDIIPRNDEANLNNLDNSFLEVSAYKNDKSDNLYVSIYDPVTQADYFTGNIKISERLTDKLRKMCNTAEKSRYNLNG
ncbi:MAG: hypothetical protein MJ180_01280 [Candidatus Gastranaerophilales bacterium]|nr:hypothetical protein [Candidatus Gastranaerophilales bacterium]